MKKQDQLIIALTGIAFSLIIWVGVDSVSSPDQANGTDVEKTQTLSKKETSLKSAAKKEISSKNLVKGSQDSQRGPASVVTERDFADRSVLKTNEFKDYRALSKKAVANIKQKKKRLELLKDPRLLNDISDFLINDPKDISHQNEQDHLQASQFLLDALKAHKSNTDVLRSLDKVLKVNLSEAQNQLPPESFKVLKETKAEVMYHGLGESKDLAKNSANYTEDPISQDIYENVLELFEVHEDQSLSMVEKYLKK